MAILSQKKTCLLWYLASQGVGQPSVAWNNDTTASPDDLRGGIPFDTGACLDEEMFLTACGTGDAGIQMAFSFLDFFLPIIPSTYIPGWPNKFGGIDTWDASSLQGSASLAGNRLNCGSSPGSVRSTTGWKSGRFCVQYQVHYDIFSQQAGAGIMRKNAQLNQIFLGEQNGGDIIGGSMVQGGNIGTTPPYQTSVNTFGVNKPGSPFIGFGDQTFMVLAIALLPQFNYVPSDFRAVKLPDLVCCPVTRQQMGGILRHGEGTP